MKISLLYSDALAPGGYPRDVRWLAGALLRAGAEVSLLARPGDHLDGASEVNLSLTSDEWQDAIGGSDVVHAFGLSDPAQLRRMWPARHAATLVISPLAHLMHEHVRVRAWKK